MEEFPQKAEIIENAFFRLNGESEKLDFLYFLFAFGKENFLSDPIRVWILNFSKTIFENIKLENLVQIAYLTKILNVIATKRPEDQLIKEIREKLFEIMILAINNEEFQLHIEFLASLAILVVNLNKNSIFDLLAKEKNSVFTLFITRAIISSFDKNDFQKDFSKNSVSWKKLDQGNWENIKKIIPRFLPF